MLIWDDAGEFEGTGHVAIVTEIQREYVRIVEQNMFNVPWPDGQHFSRQLPVRVGADGSYQIECSYEGSSILGWVMPTNDRTHAEFESATEPSLLELNAGKLDEAQTESFSPPDPTRDEEAYAAHMGGYVLTNAPGRGSLYVRTTEAAFKELRHATNELHAMFMQATDRVLERDDLLRRFDLPEVLWPRLRKSWNDRRNHMITGRFDLSVSAHGVKVYEYNADSAACYMECGRVQSRWAELHGLTDGRCAGAQLHEHLMHAWRKAEVGDILHILLDCDPEETYHALFMQSAMEAGGVRTKIVRGLSELNWGPGQTVVDADGEPIRWVWKTWAWETALDQLRAECDEDDRARFPHLSHGDAAKPRLADVLLRPDVTVFEPLWTLVTSNKALLPVLWEMFPDHPNLLNSAFTCTPELVRSGYVAKPIVGRCGANISMVAAGNEILGSTSGQFEARDTVYQELFGLPTVHDLHTQISTFAVDGRYAGACARVDTSPIITGGSDLLPLRIVEDASALGAKSR